MRASAPLIIGLVACLCASPLAGQTRREYRFEAGLAGTYTSYDDATDLGGAAGGLLRVGYWLPYNLSLEAEGGLAKPKTESADVGVSVKSFWGALLYNVPIGLTSTFYVKGGYGVVTYGQSSCPAVSLPGSGPCGSAGTLLGALGARFGVTPTLMIRTEAGVTRTTSVSFSNVNLNAGVSFMLGSRPVVDSDRDGVLDPSDDCPDTPRGVLTDRRGCASDTDNDGVPDGIDRCPDTAPGTEVDAVGCVGDEDRDGVPDTADKCADTPVGATVDENGCPADSDRDKVFDGLDRCPRTPEGATVDALGCPEDRDNDGVYEGLDRCPNTPAGTPVNATGCPTAQDADRDGIPDTTDRCPGTSAGVRVDARGCPAAPGQQPGPVTPEPGRPEGAVWPRVVPGSAFATGSARLQPDAQPALDSIVALLQADTTTMIEITGHAYEGRDEEDNQRLSRLRAEAVRNYFIEKGLSFQRLVARGLGSKQPVTSDPSPEGRIANRRVEVQPIPEGP